MDGVYDEHRPTLGEAARVPSSIRRDGQRPAGLPDRRCGSDLALSVARKDSPYAEAFRGAEEETPVQQRRRVLYDAGHSPLPRGPAIRETVDWFDEYLGPVN